MTSDSADGGPTSENTSTNETGSEISRLLPVDRRDLLNTMGAAVVFSGRGERMRPSDWRSDFRSGSEALVDTSGRVGTVVDTDGERALVGTRVADGPAGTGPGLVSVYRSVETGWARTGALVEEDGPGGFGESVAVSGTIAVVGADYDTREGGVVSGSATVFLLRDGEWRRPRKLGPTDPIGMERFGAAVAVDDDTILVGAPTEMTEARVGGGAVSVFTVAEGDIVRHSKLVPDDDIERFGRALAVDDDTAVVGGVLDRSTVANSGAAIVYRRSGERWTRETRLTPAETDRDDKFGTTVALDRDTVVVGAPSETNANGSNAGAAYVFQRAGTRWRRHRLLSPDGTSDERFGTDVAIAGDRLLVGAEYGGEPDTNGLIPSGRTYVFDRRGDSSTWTASHDDGPGKQATHLGTAVAIGSGTGIVTADGSERTNGPDGVIDVFEL